MNIFKDSFVLTLSKGLKAFVSLILTMIICRVMTETDYGTYKQLMLLFGICTTIIPLGIPITVSFYYKNLTEKKKHSLFTNTVIISFILSTITLLFLIIFRTKIGTFFNNSSIYQYLMILFIYSFIGILFNYMENLYVSSNNSILLSKINIVYFIIYLIIVSGITYVYKNIEYILISLVLLELLKSLYMILKIIHKENFQFKPNFLFLKEQLIYAIPLGLTTIIQTINLYVDNLFISNLYSAYNYAIYSVAATEVPFVSIITISLATVALPEMSKAYNSDKNLEKVINIWNQITIIGVVAIFPAFAVLLFFSKGYIEFIFSSKYIEATTIFIIYLIRLPLSCTVFSNILVVLGKQKCMLTNIIIGTLFNIIMNFILIKSLGMIGSALATVMMHILLIFLQMYQIKKYSHYSILKLLDLKKISIILLISILVALILFLLSNIINLGNRINLLVYGTGTYVICMLIFIKMGTISKKFLLRKL
jgi:O-antigen/teichoic acid export membrane protein